MLYRNVVLLKVGMRQATTWILIQLIFLVALHVRAEGKKRREKPFRWQDDIAADGTLEYPRSVQGSVVFTYSLQYDESRDCQKSLPSNVSYVNLELDMIRSPEMPAALYLGLLKNEIDIELEEQYVYPRGKSSLPELRICLGRRDRRGALLVVSADSRPICEDHFNDRTAVALCRLHGFKTGRRTSMSLADRQHAYKDILEKWYMDGSEIRIMKRGLFVFDEHRPKCFSIIKPVYYTGEAGRQMLNVTTIDNCLEYGRGERSFPCANNQAAAVFCHDGVAPFLQFYDIYIREGIRKFYITFKVRYVKLGRIYDYFEDSLKSVGVMPKRSDFSAVMCGKNFGVDLQTTRNMGIGRHLVILGKFLKKCDECLDLKFKDISVFKDSVICKGGHVRTIRNH